MQLNKDLNLNTTFPRLLAGATLAATLAACGAGGSSSGNADAAASGNAPVIAATLTASTTTWTNCGMEYGTCSFTGTKQVRFGANGAYVVKTLTGPVACAITTFGSDPASGVQKSCDTAPVPTTTTTTPTTTTPTWTSCAKEYGTCSVPGTRQVRYGASGKYAYKTVTTSVLCNNSVFGDPAVGLAKTCDYSSATGTTTTPTTPPPTTTAPTQPTASVLPVPTNIANGATVNLNCGQTYKGTLELTGKSNVTVTTLGTCGKATISPGNAITGWTKYSGNIYSAPIGFTPTQVAISGNPLSKAHWPNSGWATSTSGMPGTDLTGATQVYLDNQSVAKTLALTSNSVSTAKPFYVEGKLWMLDIAGEWAVQNGRLYVWTADGQSPEGRTWASPNANGINADNSSGITINNIKIFATTNGISANTATGMKVLNTDIANSELDGIWASGSQKLTVDQSSVSNARRSGIDGWYSIVGASVTNTTVNNTGMVGMTTPSDAGIFFGDGSNNLIQNVHVTNSSYHGISVLHNRNTNLLNSVVDNACARLTDCAGIYTGARDQLPLTLKIEGNTVNNVKGTEGIGIYLDDFANGVTVNRNTITNSTRGMVLHNAFNNVITNNKFSTSAVTHLSFAQDSGNIRNNQVTGNAFNSTVGEQTYNLQYGTNLKTYGTFNTNTYTSTNVNVFGRYWDGKSAGVTTSFSGWKAWLGQDTNSTMNGRL
jgi:parallel beta-helix repeat protein